MVLMEAVTTQNQSGMNMELMVMNITLTHRGTNIQIIHLSWLIQKEIFMDTLP